MHGQDEEGNLSQSTSLQKCLSGHAVIQQRPHAGTQETDPGCTGELGLVPKECLRRMRRGDGSPAHRAAPVSSVFLRFPSQLDYLPAGFVWPHSRVRAQAAHGHGPAGSSPGCPRLCPKHTSAPRPLEHLISPKMG